MAAHLKEALGVETELIPGSRGVFKVFVGDAVVAQKTYEGFPTPDVCLEGVRAALS